MIEASMHHHRCCRFRRVATTSRLNDMASCLIAVVVAVDKPRPRALSLRIPRRVP